MNNNHEKCKKYSDSMYMNMIHSRGFKISVVVIFISFLLMYASILVLMLNSSLVLSIVLFVVGAFIFSYFVMILHTVLLSEVLDSQRIAIELCRSGKEA